MSNRGWKQTALAGIRFTAILSTVALLGAAAQAQSLLPVPSATKAAGTGENGFSSDSGSASGLKLSTPAYNVFDSQGNQYISDAGNNCIRKVDTSGQTSTVAGFFQSGQSDTCNSSLNKTPSAANSLSAPAGIALDGFGNIYVADTGHNCVRKLGSGAVGVANMTTVVGDCTLPAASSAVPAPIGLAVDAAGNLYVSTRGGANQVLRHRSSDAATTFCYIAGAAFGSTAACGGSTPPTLSQPAGLALDPLGNLFIADMGNLCVRELTPAGVFTTAVGQCVNGGATGATTPGFTSPAGLTFGQNGKLYITGSSNVFELALPGQLNLIAGLASGATGPYLSSQDGAPAVNVPLSSPQGMAADPAGNIFVVDSQNNIVRKLAVGTRFPDTAVGSASAAQPVYFVVTAPVSPTATAGSDYKIASSTCNGALQPSKTSVPTTCEVSVQFLPLFPGARRSPLTLTDSATGTRYSWGLNGVGLGAQAHFLPGTITTLLASLANPAAVRLDSKGNVYFAEAGTGNNGDVKFIALGSTTPTTLIAAGTGLNTPTALALDSAGNLYIADKGTGSVFKFDGSGNLSTFVSGLTDPEALATDSFDNLYIADASTHAVTEIYQGGQNAVIAGQGAIANANGVPAVQASFSAPSGLAVDSHGVIYIADSTGYRVYSVDAQRVIHYLVGNGTTSDTAPGSALGTGLKDPRDLVVDPAGDVYIADGTGNRSILVYSASQQNPQVNTIAGTGTAGNSGDAGPSKTAQLNNPVSMALDGQSNIYIVDAGNNALREIVYSDPVLDFGSVKAGDVTPVQTVTLWNTGNQDLTSITKVLSDSTNFTIDSASTLCGTTVISGATCNYGFQFNPQAPGTYTATTTLTDSLNPAQIITLTGIATIQGATPPIINPTTPYTGTYGTPYTWTAGVTGAGATPSGTLTFVINGVPLCRPATLDGTLHASCSPSPTALAAGTYSMLIEYSGDINYPGTSIATTATIFPAPVTITANSFSRPYGQLNPVFTGTITGVVPGETITSTYSTTATQFSPAGSYPIVPVAAAGPGTSLSNYAITIVNGTLTITQAGAVTVVVDNAARIYGVPNPPFTSTITNGANGDTITVTYSTPATLNSPVGAYPILAALSGSSSGNYNGATVVAGTLTITKAPTTLALTSSSGVSVPGSAITFSVAVTSPSQIVPDGIVTFADGGTPIGTATLDATGHASFSTSALSLGSHTITATYAGTINFLASTASLTQAVGIPGKFAITATPPYQEVKGAGSNIYQVTVKSVDGFFGDVTLSCAGLPSDAGCAFSPATVTLTAGGSAIVKLTTTTTLADAKTDAKAAAVTLPAPGGSGMMPLLAWTMFPMQLGGAATLLAGGLRRRKKQSLWKRLALLVPLVLLVVGISGCGCSVTQFHTYTITIIGTTTSGGAPLTATTTVTLTAIQ